MSLTYSPRTNQSVGMHERNKYFIIYLEVCLLTEKTFSYNKHFKFPGKIREQHFKKHV